MKNTCPFLKWAGGKRWLSQRLSAIHLPAFSRYIEPFLGGGAIFFHLRPAHSILTDLNAPLIETYRAIRNRWKTVYGLLEMHQEKHSESYYYSVRSTVPSDIYERAARFIYLNRVCWNGLYRVNRKGEFNVPIGTKTQVILPTDDFADVARLLAGSKLRARDFTWSVAQACEGDLVYVDPPYTINHDRNGFLKYNQRLFAWDDQIRLHAALLQARQRGAYVVVSNAHHQSLRALYSGTFSVETVERFSRISGSNTGRRAGHEYLFVGGPL